MKQEQELVLMEDGFPMARPVVTRDLSAAVKVLDRIEDTRIDAEREARKALVLRVARALWEIVRIHFPDLGSWGEAYDFETQSEFVVMLDHYDRTRQWSPIPVGHPAAQMLSLQGAMCEVASSQLGVSPLRNAFGESAPPRPPKGWASGRVQPKHTQVEIEAASRMGFEASSWARSEKPARWEELSDGARSTIAKAAEKVLTLAKIHQVDAIRVAVLEHGIDAAFAGAIVGDVCLGGAARRI